jgi:hypothetical protein
VRDNKKTDFRQFLNSFKLSIVAAKSVQVMSPYTSNASNSHTVLHTLWTGRGGEGRGGEERGKSEFNNYAGM